MTCLKCGKRTTKIICTCGFDFTTAGGVVSLVHMCTAKKFLAAQTRAFEQRLHAEAEEQMSGLVRQFKGYHREKIFISSTYKDLVHDRENIIDFFHRCQEVDPLCMEFIVPTNETPLSGIRKMMNDATAYILVLRASYGTIVPKCKKSYTEWEYDYALKRGIPVFAFVYDPAEVKQIEAEGTDWEAFKKFRKKIMKKQVYFWKDSTGLLIGVTACIHQHICDQYLRHAHNGIPAAKVSSQYPQGSVTSYAPSVDLSIESKPEPPYLEAEKGHEPIPYMQVRSLSQ